MKLDLDSNFMTSINQKHGLNKTKINFWPFISVLGTNGLD